MYFTEDTSDLVEREEVVRYLGVMLSEDAQFKNHIDKVVAKTRQKSGWILKGGYRKFFFLSQVPLGIIYDGKIVETARSDLKTVQKCKNSSFLGLEIKRSGFGAG